HTSCYRDWSSDVCSSDLAALRDASVPALLDQMRTIASIIPIIGFYLQPTVGGRVLPYEFWREFSEIPNLVAIKIAPFNRYQTLRSEERRVGEACEAIVGQ